MVGQIVLIYNTPIHLFMQSSEEKTYISLDLTSPCLNTEVPNNVSWLNLKDSPIHNDFILKKIKKFILIFNQQVPWRENITIDDVYKFLFNGNDINILIQNSDFIGWAWQNKKEGDFVFLKSHQFYTSKLLIDRKFLFKKTNKHITLWWIQQLKKFYKKQQFTQAVAYVDSWNKGVLKSLLKAGYEIKNWN